MDRDSDLGPIGLSKGTEVRKMKDSIHIRFIEARIKVLFFVLALLLCGSLKAQNDDSITKEIENLSTDQSRRDFLEALFKDDQKYRGGFVQNAMIKYGKESNEYREAILLLRRQDSINLLKVEAYLAAHGNPQRSKVGEIAAVTPWAVIHHASDYEAKARNFKILHEAYLNGDIDSGEKSMLLGRMYRIKFGEAFKSEQPLKETEKIDQMIKKLDLN